MKNISIDYLYTKEEYVTFNIKVESGDFSGKSIFCMYKTKFLEFIDSLKNTYLHLSGECIMYDCDSDDYLQVKWLKYGHVIVEGQLGGSFNEKYLKYSMELDQSYINLMINKLNKFLTY